MSNFKKLTVHTKQGIEDLTSTYPYANAHDWPVWSPAFPDVTKESYEADVKGYEKRVNELNNAYIAKLKESGGYGKPKATHFNFMSMPEFEDPKPIDYGDFKMFIPKGNLK